MLNKVNNNRNEFSNDFIKHSFALLFLIIMLMAGLNKNEIQLKHKTYNNTIPS